jgi:acyl-CoA reductase-like NAD-dependent aldehyde dehydrogenase
LLAPPALTDAPRGGPAGDETTAAGSPMATTAVAASPGLHADGSAAQPLAGDDPRHAALHQFRNHPPKRLFLHEERELFAAALAAVRRELGREYPLRFGGEEVRSRSVTAVPDPSHPDGPPAGFVHNAEPEQVERALALAVVGAERWGARPVTERGDILRRAADLLAARRDLTAAWIVYEGAKSWAEALADVDEAIDYLRYYALLAETQRAHWHGYRPRGVVAVIPPWNFPLAIPCGMTASALVAGNAAILKPAEQTPIIALKLVETLHEAGVPEDALIWLPGPGETAGAALVASPLVDMVAFTGSRAVGTAIYRAGSRVLPARGGLRATLAEMGGKNPVLVFPDADLDEAVVGILRSAFGHANQKCSAASRVLIHRDVYPRLRERLVEGARSLPVGPADQPGTLITPLIDDEARARVLQAGEVARREGRVLLDELENPDGAPDGRRVSAAKGIDEPGERPHAPGSPEPAQGTLLGPEIVEIAPAAALTARTAQEEIFGPVLALIPFSDDAEALRIANGTRYALTGGVFSRSPGTVSRMVRALDAGNLYVNRPVTGARVGVEPFGGHRMSGTGPKAGGEEYLWAFVTSRAGLRAGAAAPSGSARLPDGALQPWRHTHPAQRGDVIRAALGLLHGAWRGRWQEALARCGVAEGAAVDLRVVDTLLGRVGEVAEPEPTVPLPGQQTETRWDTPRGCGLVLVDRSAPPRSLPALLVGGLLAGNGLAVLPHPDLRPPAEVLIAALHHEGVPATALLLAPDEPDLAAMIAVPSVTFVALDAGEAQTRAVYRLLGETSADPSATHLKALITLADGPGPVEPGFLRRFALPKTVAVQTLHLGAELELLTSAGE